MIKKAAVLLLGLGLALSTLGVQAAHADVNSFRITDYEINYKLSRDADKHSLLTTKETITADFPQTDQNHGIERAILSEYNTHKTDIKITAVTDGQGKARNYTTYDSGGNLVVRIGEADRYVHGEQTYVISYTQRDVTRHFTDTKGDEFYWNANGVQWQVPIDSLRVTLTLDKSLASSLNGNTACYEGQLGTNNPCELTRDGTTFMTSAGPLNPGDNITFAVGFNTGTFAKYQMPWYERLTYIVAFLQYVLLPVMIGLIIWLVVMYRRRSDRKSEINTIIPEYLPPAGTSVTTAAKLTGSNKAFAAQLIDLAVRHYIRILQTKEKKGMFGQDEYAIEIIRPINDLLPEEKELLNDIFDSKTSVGTRLDMSELQKHRNTFAMRLSDNQSKLNSLVSGRYALRGKSDEQSKWFRTVAKWLLVFMIILLSPVLLPAVIVAYIMSWTIHPLTDKGVELVRYLKGLKMYIKVAEQDRLKMLQSPDGAPKVGINPSDPAQLVKLYERVLPYAILFGQEKEWNNQLGKYYETLQTQPDWYVGSPGMTAFSAASFSSAISSFSASTYTATPSSSSGGSTGGGFSGGGGGGGGGGGW